jgi:GNAT superfamily N-acetyltransferase
MWSLDPAISTVAHYKGEACGVIICIPDLNPFMKATKGRYGLSTPYHFLQHKLHRDRAVIVLYSVKQAHHGQGLNAAMLSRVFHALRRRGFKRCGGTWIGDSNVASLRQMQKLGGRTLHRINLFRKALA